MTQVQAFKIRNDLIEAYKGYYEDEMVLEYSNHEQTATLSEFMDNWVRSRIIRDTPRERLEVYCEWNGIIGYASTLYEIATGSISV